MAESESWVIIPKLDKDKTGCVLEMRPLVLCKDCKFYTDPQICPVFGMDRCDDWFCADGKRAKEEA